MERGRRKRERGLEEEGPGSLQGAEGGVVGLGAGSDQRLAQHRDAGVEGGQEGGQRWCRGAAMGQGEEGRGRGKGEEAAGTSVPGPEEALSICSPLCGATNIPGPGF